MVLHRLDLLDALLKIGHDQGFEAARRILTFDQGPQYMDEIRQGIQDMEHDEQEVLASRFAQQESSSRRLQWMVMLSCSAALFLLAVSLAVVLQDLSAVEAAFRKANYHVAHDALTGLSSRHSLMVATRFRHCANRYAAASRCRCASAISTGSNPSTTPTGTAPATKSLPRSVNSCATAFAKAILPDAWAGDEFCIVLPNTGAESAGPLMERLRQRWERLEYDAGGCAFSVTASFGVVQHSGERSAKALLHTADKALYCAKGEGRNRIHLVA